MQISHTTIFPKIIGYTMMPGFEFIQEPIIDWIYNYQKTDEGVVKSNNGGWQSKSNFYNQESFSSFLDPLNSVIQSYIDYTYKKTNYFTLLNAWININHPGTFNVYHNHPMSDISGCFYIKVPKESGILFFKNHDDFVNAKCLNGMDEELKDQFNYDLSYGIIPSEGSVFFFPSFMDHQVTQNNSKYDRISIAFNLGLYSNYPVTN